MLRPCSFVGDGTKWFSGDKGNTVAFSLDLPGARASEGQQVRSTGLRITWSNRSFYKLANLASAMLSRLSPPCHRTSASCSKFVSTFVAMKPTVSCLITVSACGTMLLFAALLIGVL